MANVRGGVLVALSLFVVAAAAAATCSWATYGFRCAYHCNCPPAECHDVNGCNSTDCYPGWSGPTCQKSNLLLNLTSDAFKSSETGTDVEKATDGNTSTDASSVCLETRNTDGNFTWWRADLGNDTLVNEVTIYFRTDFGRSEIQVYLTNSSDIIPSGHTCNNVNGNANGTVTSVTCATHGRFLLLYSSFQGTNSTTPRMVLCEVEVNVCGPGTYGNECSEYCHCDSEACNYIEGVCPSSVCQPGWHGMHCNQICDNGTYGFNCSGQCGERNCSYGNSSCDHETGECDGGCNAGWGGTDCTQGCDAGQEYGAGCSRNCSDRMCEKDSNCSVLTGQCEGGCQEGWMGEDCYEHCDNGTYGINCSGQCGERNCSNDNFTCDHETGECVGGCNAGWGGTDCTQGCDAGQEYGAGCSRNCSDRMCEKDSNCSVLTGQCEGGCQQGWMGEDCYERCGFKTYGVNCSGSCGECRDKTTCDHINGTCRAGCGVGWTGKLCDENSSQTMPTTTIIAAAAGGGCGVVVIVLITIVLCIRRRRNRKTSQLAANGYSTVSSQEKALQGTTRVLDAPPVVYSNVTFTGEGVDLDDNVKEEEQGDAADKRVDEVDEVVEVDEVEAEVEGVDGDVDHQEMEEPGGDSTYYNLESPPLNTEVGVDKLGDRIKEMQATKYGFQKEFRVLFVGFTRPYGVSQQDGHQGKNRFQGYYPYDYNRVLLSKSSDDPHSHYINASYIDGFTQKKAYIAAQAPNTLTVCDFWRMIWEINCSRIVMLTNLVETCKVKCEPYWLDKGDLDVGLFTISVTKICHRSHWIIRDLEAKSKETGNSRHFQQFHFITWPDHGTPDSTALMEFLWRIRATPNPQGSPLLVHCSAGIGRTGTYIAVDYLLDQALADRKLDVFGFVTQMRDQRKGMVQTKEQYAFIYTTLHQALTFGNTAMDVSEFSHKRSTNKTFPMGSMDIRVFLERANQEIKIASSAQETKGRILLDGKKDIWAVSSPSRLCVRGYVITEVPSTITSPQFWRLTEDKGSTNVITMLLNFKNVEHFLPNPGNNLDLSSVNVNCIGETNVNPDITLRNFKIQTRGSSTPTSVDVYLIHQLSAVSHSSLLELIEAIDLSATGDNLLPVTVVFSEATRRQAILFCILNNIIQGVKHDSTVEIYNNIRYMTHLLQDNVTVEDVSLCFDVASAYLDPESVYANL
ncbi:receptor-type tyrosine-protein phosphatase mu-like isoform X2 [Haliotis cracherodii]|uniref:receptor-type tyrosine-protein phosphatase mu-like isoform X2 n=1 Tax=Haliotis cracherodii TaxID=6455 RepID=UPI0039EB0974